mgnify:CR=1 FL=1
MDASMWIAKTGLDAQQTRMTVISNNLANVNTTGFKRDRAAFEDLLYQTVRQPGGQVLHSYTLLTINADAHPFMRQFHKPDDEKRMIVLLPPARYDEWLRAGVEQSGDFLRAWPAEALLALDPLEEERGLF